MRREDLYHVVAAAAQIVGESEFVVVGSQAILGSHADAPEALLRSQEVDIYPRSAPEKAIAIEGALGDGSHRPGDPSAAHEPAACSRALPRTS